MITLTIIGIISALTIPSLQSFLDNGHIRAASSQISSALYYGRNYAITQQQSVIICLSDDEKSCNTQKTGQQVIILNEMTSELVHVSQLPSKVSVRYQGFNPRLLGIVYKPMGLAVNNGSFHISIGNALKNTSSLPTPANFKMGTIYISKSGRIRHENQLT